MSGQVRTRLDLHRLVERSFESSDGGMMDGAPPLLVANYQLEL